jgi:hypothetical protein
MLKGLAEAGRKTKLSKAKPIKSILMAKQCISKKTQWL